jgi:ABC-type glycerol-3-phosphate transport system permease component
MAKLTPRIVAAKMLHWCILIVFTVLQAFPFYWMVTTSNQ